MRLLKLVITILYCLWSLASFGNIRDTIDLAGSWHYLLLGAPSSIPGEGRIQLPNTLDNARKSVYQPPTDNTTQLRREFSFSGEATYSRLIRIPQNWDGSIIELFLERTKPSTVKIDGKIIGSNSRVSSPQRYDLTNFITPGIHTLEISVNNADSIPPMVASGSNAMSESTQTNWNGILGEISLIRKNPFHIKSIIINDKIPEPNGFEYRIDSLSLHVNFSVPASQDYLLKLKDYPDFESSIKINKGDSFVNLKLPVDGTSLWSSNKPVVHDINLSISDSHGEVIDDYNFSTGFRDFSSSGKIFSINGHPIFLRGVVNSAIFPLTTHAPTDEKTWERYFSVLKDYGINHVRFHSWTPPDAAFKVADKMGFYLLVELPLWGSMDREMSFHNRFLREDMKGIMEEYSHHPSFVMFSPGNELWGDISLMGDFMKEAKDLNPRVLSTYGTNVYLGLNGEIGGEDFIISAKTNDKVENSLRGSISFADSSSGGYFNSHYPGSSYNLGEITETISVPIISHEVGQYQSYPDFSEIERYTGNLKADNLKEFKRRAEEAGTLPKNQIYKEASGKWAAQLYKAEMELAQRSPGIAGVELFGLQDYPGQGTALVGLLNPFMESKGFISPEIWKQSSSDLMLLAEFPKFSFSSGESIEIPLLLINYNEDSPALSKINWDTGFSKGIIEFKTDPDPGVNKLGTILIEIPEIIIPQKFTLNLSSDDDRVTNQYSFWVYPKELPEVKGVKVTTDLKEALKWLGDGDNVILSPDSSLISKSSIPPLFTTDFWNYRMYRTICEEMGLETSPGTLGLYIDKKHPSFKKFPTDHHTDWQWYPIINNSRPLIIDRLPIDFEPIVEVIDNVERNYRLAMILECKVDKGKLMIVSADLDKISEYPEGRWLIQSLKEYMAGKSFNPKVTLTPEQIENLLTKPSNSRLIKELKNPRYRFD